MLKVNKQTIDSVIQAQRNYASADFDGMSEIHKFIGNRSKELASNTGVNWLSWQDLFWVVLDSEGFMPKASNEDFYRVLNTLGVEVVDD